MEGWNDEDVVNRKVRAAARTGSEYSLVTLENVPLKNIFPKSSVNHLAGVELNFRDGGPEGVPFALMGIFKQTPKPRPEPWPESIAVLFLGYEATAAYDLLFCQEGQQPPLAVAIQAGMNMGFGNGSPLASLAARTGVLPRYLQGVEPRNDFEQWDGYLFREVATNYPCGRRYRRQNLG